MNKCQALSVSRKLEFSHGMEGGLNHRMCQLMPSSLQRVKLLVREHTGNGKLFFSPQDSL